LANTNNEPSHTSDANAHDRGIDRNGGPVHEAREPIFNIPPMVLTLLAIMVAVMLYRMTLNEDADNTFVLAMALIPARLSGFASDLPGGTLAIYTQFLTHMFTHADAMHLAFNGASLLAFAGALEKRIGAIRLLLFFLVCGFAAAITFIVLNPGLFAPMIGASGAIAGLMGGVMRFFFSAMDGGGGLRRLNQAPRAISLKTLPSALRDRRLQIVTASFIVMNVAAMIGFGDLNANNSIAWEAHIGGYIAGLLLFGFFDIAPHHELSSFSDRNEA
jgi:membrane associated rhomboid family serine protease